MIKSPINVSSNLILLYSRISFKNKIDDCTFKFLSLLADQFNERAVECDVEKRIEKLTKRKEKLLTQKKSETINIKKSLKDKKQTNS